MNIKEISKPNIFKVIIFLFIGIFYLYVAKDNVCGIGLFFQFCYDAYGFPLSYFITGDIDSAFGHIKTLFLGDNFRKYGNLLFNPTALVLDLIFIYLLACFAYTILNPKLKIKT